MFLLTTKYNHAEASKQESTNSMSQSNYSGQSRLSRLSSQKSVPPQPVVVKLKRSKSAEFQAWMDHADQESKIIIIDE